MKEHPADTATREAIRNADHFDVSIFLGTGQYDRRTEIADLKTAIETCASMEQFHANGRKAMIYAIAPEGGSVLVPPAFLPSNKRTNNDDGDRKMTMTAQDTATTTNSNATSAATAAIAAKGHNPHFDGPAALDRARPEVKAKVAEARTATDKRKAALAVAAKADAAKPKSIAIADSKKPSASAKKGARKNSVSAKSFTDEVVKRSIAMMKRKDGVKASELAKEHGWERKKVLVRRMVRDAIRGREKQKVKTTRDGRETIYKIAS